MNAWTGEVGQVMVELRAAVVPERREKAASYFPSSMEVLGVPVPPLRKVVRRLAREFNTAPLEDVTTLARALLVGLGGRLLRLHLRPGVEGRTGAGR